MQLTFNGKTGLETSCPVCGGEAEVRKNGSLWRYVAAEGCTHLNLETGSGMVRDEAISALSEVRAWNVPGISHNGWPVA